MVRTQTVSGEGIQQAVHVLSDIFRNKMTHKSKKLQISPKAPTCIIVNICSTISHCLLALSPLVFKASYSQQSIYKYIHTTIRTGNLAVRLSGQ